VPSSSCAIILKWPKRSEASFWIAVVSTERQLQARAPAATEERGEETSEKASKSRKKAVANA